MSISLKVDNSQLNKAANLFARFIPSLEGTEKDVEGILGTANKLQFESLGRRGNTPWDQLKPATLKEKERLGFGNEQVLVRTGKFEQVIINPQVRTESGGMQQVASFSGEHAEFINYFQDRFPLFVYIQPDFNELGQAVAKKNVKSLDSQLKGIDI